MKIAIMQPTYLPWIGYFELMAQSDVFVVMDDVQFVKKSWQHRNRIKSQTGELMLSVPIVTAGRRFQPIAETEVDARQPWATKHYKSIEFSYAKAPYAARYLPELKAMYERPWKMLAEVNHDLIFFLSRAMAIKTPIVFASSISCRKERNEHIIDLCKACGGHLLYDAGGAADVIDAAALERECIRVVFQSYTHPEYRQLHGPFLSHLSALDFIGDVDWSVSAPAKDWYARMKSRPCFRGVLGDRLPGITTPEHYADLDF